MVELGLTMAGHLVLCEVCGLFIRSLCVPRNAVIEETLASGGRWGSRWH